MADDVRERLRAGQRRCREVFAEVKAHLRTGMTEADLAEETDRLLRKQGASNLWAPTLVSFGKNTVLCYPDFLPGDNRLRENDIIVMDVGPDFDGYLSDYCETWTWGDGAAFQEAIDDARALQRLAIESFRADRTASDLYWICQRWIDDEGYLLRDLLGNVGHSIGTVFAEHGFLDRDNQSRLVGAWTIEPHIGMGPRFARTEREKYGEREAGLSLGPWGAKFEDIVFVDADGAELLR